MSARGLQTLLASAIVDGTYKDSLLGCTPAAFTGFDLSTEEVGMLMDIRAASLEDFAVQAHMLFYNEDLLLETRVVRRTNEISIAQRDIA